MDHLIGKPGIAGIQDLKGKRIGFSGVGAVTHFAALSLAKKLGWNPDRDMTLVAGSATLDALKQDKVDAILASAMGHRARAAGGIQGHRRSHDLPASRWPARASWWTRRTWPRIATRCCAS